MSCASCKFWERRSTYGDCLCPAMAVTFTPYSDPEASRLGFNADRPLAVPLTAQDYECGNWA